MECPNCKEPARSLDDAHCYCQTCGCFELVEGEWRFVDADPVDLVPGVPRGVDDDPPDHGAGVSDVHEDAPRDREPLAASAKEPEEVPSPRESDRRGDGADAVRHRGDVRRLGIEIIGWDGRD